MSKSMFIFCAFALLIVDIDYTFIDQDYFMGLVTSLDSIMFCLLYPIFFQNEN